MDASVGGKLAQVGSRLIDGAAHKMADDFFARFQEEVGRAGTPGEETGVAGEVEAEASPGTSSPGAEASGGSGGAGGKAEPSQGTFYESGGKWMIWLAAFGALLLALLFAF